MLLGRDITGSFNFSGAENGRVWGGGSGAFKATTTSQKNFLNYRTHSSNQSLVSRWDFAASNVVHTDSDVHPYSMRVLYLIAY